MENRGTLLAWVGIASELGFLIAVPIVAFALLGRLLDRSFGTHVLFLSIGIVLAVFSSAFLIARRLNRMLKRLV